MAMVPYGYEHMDSSLFSEKKKKKSRVTGALFHTFILFISVTWKLLVRYDSCTLQCPHLKPSFGNTEAVAGNYSITKLIKNQTKKKAKQNKTNQQKENPTKQHGIFSIPEDTAEERDRAQPRSLFRFAVSCYKLSAH